MLKLEITKITDIKVFVIFNIKFNKNNNLQTTVWKPNKKTQITSGYLTLTKIYFADSL